MGAVKYIFVFGFLVLMGFHSEQDYETISWNADKGLSWDDFKGKTPQNSRVAAITASGITYQFSTSGTRDNMEIDFEISAHFYPNKSWYQSEICDDVVLGHEQLHFDISELYARKMRKRLGNTKVTKNVKAEVKSIYREIIKDLDDFQNTYDDETNFSRNLEQQLIWNAKIAEALKK